MLYTKHFDEKVVRAYAHASSVQESSVQVKFKEKVGAKLLVTVTVKIGVTIEAHPSKE